MTEPLPRFPNGDRKYSSHIELEKQGWIRGDYADRPCKLCGEKCEWWGRAPIGSEGWTLFNPRTTHQHKETCKPRR